MNSKFRKEQKIKIKKGHHVHRSSNFDPNSDKRQKKGQNDDGLIQLILGRVRVMPYYSAAYLDSTRHIPSCDVTSAPVYSDDCLYTFADFLTS